MDFLSIAMILFIIMESANVAILYFWPGSRLGNGVGVFNAFSNPESEEQRLFASYLVNWVAGVKLIFLFLLAVILVIGTEQVKLWAVVAMICPSPPTSGGCTPPSKSWTPWAASRPRAIPRRWAG